VTAVVSGVAAGSVATVVSAVAAAVVVGDSADVPSETVGLGAVVAAVVTAEVVAGSAGSGVACSSGPGDRDHVHLAGVLGGHRVDDG